MEYILTTPKDANGQPLRLFKANYENNVCKAIDQLSGICSGILADGTVTEAEARFFADFVRKFAPYEPVWPFTDILARVEQVFADGVCNEHECEELKVAMQALCGQQEQSKPQETYSTTLPFDTPLPASIVFPDHTFVVTGKFAYGTRKAVFNVIETLGGIPTDTPPIRDTNYVVIGLFASRDWANTNFGRKIERAVKLRDSGCGLSIIPEQHWKQFVD